MTEPVLISSDPSFFDYVLHAYLHEAEILANTARSEHFTKLLTGLSDYQRMLETETGRYAGRLSALVEDRNILRASRADPELDELHACANLAASCAIFNDWKLQVKQLGRDQLRQLIREAVPGFHGKDQGKATLLCDKLNGADTIRVFTMLRLFGLVPDDLSRSRQISLGAARGTRDLHSLHLYPEIEHYQPPAIMNDPPPETIRFMTHLRKPHDVVLVDNHPAYQSYYESLASKWSGKVIGVPKDSYDALETFFSDSRTRDLKPRDLVVAFRIDHRGIPDVERFLDLLGPVIAESAHFVMTMGSGHSLDEFKGRVNTMRSFRERLLERGLAPFHFIWHKGKSVEKQFHNPLFGAPGYASYEVLYCRLDKQLLVRA